MLKSLSSELPLGSKLEICDRPLFSGALACIFLPIFTGAVILECLENPGDMEICCGLGEGWVSSGGVSGADSIGYNLIVY